MIQNASSKDEAAQIRPLGSTVGDQTQGWAFVGPVALQSFSSAASGSALSSGDGSGRTNASSLGAAEGAVVGAVVAGGCVLAAASLAGAPEPPLPVHAATRTAMVIDANGVDRRVDADRPSTPLMCSLTVPLPGRLSSACKVDADRRPSVGSICADITSRRSRTGGRCRFRSAGSPRRWPGRRECR